MADWRNDEGRSPIREAARATVELDGDNGDKGSWLARAPPLRPVGSSADDDAADDADDDDE